MIISWTNKGGSSWPTVTNPDSAAPEPEISAKSDRRREMRKNKTMGEGS